MIQVTLQTLSDGSIYGMRCQGHAGYAPAGSDIICAAITALSGTLIGSFIDLLDIQPEYVLEDGNICCTVDPSWSTHQHWPAIQLLFDAFELGCRQIQQNYGSKFVRVCIAGGGKKDDSV